jgi:hypothetical protein
MTGADGNNLAQRMADKNGSNAYGADGYVNFEKKDDITTLTVWSGRNKSGEQGAFQMFKSGEKAPDANSAVRSISINSKTGEVKLEPAKREAQTGSHIKR